MERKAEIAPADDEAVAVLLSGYDDETGRFRSTVVLRDGHGQIHLHDVAPGDAVARSAVAAGGA